MSGLLKKFLLYVGISIATHYVINHVPTLHDTLSMDRFPNA